MAAAVPVVFWFNVGKLVRFEALPLTGVPSTAAIMVGLVSVLLVSVWEPASVTTFVARMPESVRVKVELEVTALKRSPVVGTDTGPTIVLEALIAAAADMVNVKALDALRKPRLPVVVLATPNIGVGVTLGAPLKLVLSRPPLAVVSQA